MAERKHPEDEGIPPSDENVPERPSDDNEQQPPLPSDEPQAAFDRGTTGGRQRGESHRTRLARERPDDPPDQSDEGERRTAGRLVRPDGDAGVGRELTADEEADDAAGLTAEEEAVTVREADEQMPDGPSTDEEAGRGADRGA